MTDATLRERAAEAAGLLRVGEMPAMILRCRLSEPGPPPGVTLGPVRTPRRRLCDRHGGRGLAALVTRAAGNAGFDLGARLASLQASPMGEPVYRRMGYETIGSYPYWVRMQPPG